MLTTQWPKQKNTESKRGSNSLLGVLSANVKPAIRGLSPSLKIRCRDAIFEHQNRNTSCCFFSLCYAFLHIFPPKVHLTYFRSDALKILLKFKESKSQLVCIFKIQCDAKMEKAWENENNFKVGAFGDPPQNLEAILKKSGW